MATPFKEWAWPLQAIFFLALAAVLIGIGLYVPGLPNSSVRQQLQTDIEAAFSGDPAAGSNDDQIAPLARALHARFGTAVVLRFIEFMDVGSTNGWRLDEVLPSRDVLARLREIGPLTALPATARGETARRWRFDATGQEIGLVSSVTQAFCGDCNRARLSTDGQLYLCLFGTHGHDLRALLRSGADDATLAAAIDQLWAGRDDRYSQLRGAATPAFDTAPTPAGERRVEMHYIGG